MNTILHSMSVCQICVLNLQQFFSIFSNLSIR
jgi:hypothetical protein